MIKKRRLKKWVKVVLGIIVIITLIISSYKDYSKSTTIKTPEGTYTCNGSIVKVCSSNKAVADYLGV